MRESSLKSFAERHGVRLVLQFGSTVVGTEHARSDLDLAVMLDELPSVIDDELEMRADLQSLFPEQEVDIAIINRADPLFLKQIMQSGRLLYGMDRDLYELQILAFKRHQDHRRYLALEEDYVRQALQVQPS